MNSLSHFRYHWCSEFGSSPKAVTHDHVLFIHHQSGNSCILNVRFVHSLTWELQFTFVPYLPSVSFSLLPLIWGLQYSCFVLHLIIRLNEYNHCLLINWFEYFTCHHRLSWPVITKWKHKTGAIFCSWFVTTLLKGFFTELNVFIWFW